MENFTEITKNILSLLPPEEQDNANPHARYARGLYPACRHAINLNTTSDECTNTRQLLTRLCIHVAISCRRRGIFFEVAENGALVRGDPQRYMNTAHLIAACMRSYAFYGLVCFHPAEEVHKVLFKKRWVFAEKAVSKGLLILGNLFSNSLLMEFKTNLSQTSVIDFENAIKESWSGNALILALNLTSMSFAQMGNSLCKTTLNRLKLFCDGTHVHADFLPGGQLHNYQTQEYLAAHVIIEDDGPRQPPGAMEEEEENDNILAENGFFEEQPPQSQGGDSNVSSQNENGPQQAPQPPLNNIN